jgi:putative RNA 2'-phosphotransferase
MDEHGWVGVEDLLATPVAVRRGMTRAVLARVVAENDKQRFEFDETGERIRARQGHSRLVEGDWVAVEPPECLYHGTSMEALASIREQGLLQRKRLHVHLSPDAGTAAAVGARHGTPVVLVVRSRAMREAGHQFFLTGNGIWLTNSVPPQFIDFP